MRCNYCSLKSIKKEAKNCGNKIVLRSSSFMGGTIIFEIKKHEKIPKYIEPCEKYPNGDQWYEEHIRSWMKEIGNLCEC
ncbi:MAG TPA: hypothetical protein VMV86_04505 [Methanosarcinales archaeon]|nr:hypothetical protein [Methanosarcinales archaeon]